MCSKDTKSDFSILVLTCHASQLQQLEKPKHLRGSKVHLFTIKTDFAINTDIVRNVLDQLAGPTSRDQVFLAQSQVIGSSFEKHQDPDYLNYLNLVNRAHKAIASALPVPVPVPDATYIYDFAHLAQALQDIQSGNKVIFIYFISNYKTCSFFSFLSQEGMGYASVQPTSAHLGLHQVQTQPTLHDTIRAEMHAAIQVAFSDMQTAIQVAISNMQTATAAAAHCFF
jgi:hypothetical protein